MPAQISFENGVVRRENTLTHHLVGYDPSTEAVAFKQPIPPNLWPKVAVLVAPAEADPDHIYSYPLDAGVAVDIMGLIGKRGEGRLDYFLECYAG